MTDAKNEGAGGASASNARLAGKTVRRSDAMKPQWTEQAKIDAVIKATGSSADAARDYLVAEEGNFEEAILSYEGDKLHAGVMR